MQLIDLDKTLARLSLSQFEIEAFCQRWQVSEFALFGSVLREDFHPDSDVDVLITFFPTVHWGLTETIKMQDELESLFGRKVDFIIKSAIERSQNWIRKQHILQSAQVLYVA